MQGYPEFNFKAFAKYTKELRDQGYFVFSPAERDVERHDGTHIGKGNPTGDVIKAEKEHGFSLRDALADDTAFICKEADMIAMMPGWEYSKGANAEWALAKALGLEIIYV